MEERVMQLERTVRWLALSVGLLVLVQVWAGLRPGPQGPAGALIPAARAEPGILEVKDGNRPQLMFTTSQSGSSLYEWRWHEGAQKYVQAYYPRP